MNENRAMAKSSGAVSIAIFIFDCSRLLFLLKLLVIYLKPGSGFGTVNLPLMMYAAPNALFPLMSFFLLIRLDNSRAYIPVYIIGKVLGLLCMMIWLFFSVRQIPEISKILWAVFLCTADIGTIMGMALRDDSSLTRTMDVTEGGE